MLGTFRLMHLIGNSAAVLCFIMRVCVCMYVPLLSEVGVWICLSGVFFLVRSARVGHSGLGMVVRHVPPFATYLGTM